MEIADEYSASLPVTSGVPQGSVIGPVLFLLYINDIAKDVDPLIEVRLFADDCLLCCRVRSVHDQSLLNDALNVISNWCAAYDMEINFDKLVCMSVTAKKSPLQFTYKIGLKEIRRTMKMKYLGVTITHNLSWNEHVANICGSAQRKLGMLRRKLKQASPDVKLKAYTMIVRPTLEYASIVWDPYRRTLINQIERIQRLAVRFIFSKYERTESVTALIDKANLPDLASRRKIARLKFF